MPGFFSFSPSIGFHYLQQESPGNLTGNVQGFGELRVDRVYESFAPRAHTHGTEFFGPILSSSWANSSLHLAAWAGWAVAA